MGGKVHLITIMLIVVLISCMYIFRHFLRKYRHFLRIFTGIGLIMSRITLDLWYIFTDRWSLQTSLPLELCSIASLLSGLMLLTKNKYLFEVLYFIAIGGSMQAILTPDLNFGFPQYRYIQFFFDHFLLLSAPLLMIWLYRFTITFRSLLKSFLSLNLLAGVVFIINLYLDANYMFLKEKPNQGSLLDFLGPYPHYILSLEIVAFVMFTLLYLPFRNTK